MHKTYSPQHIESKHYQHWEERGYFNAEATRHSDRGSWSLMIPPPNVTGSLHMGHAFQDTIMDFLVRYHRMQGYNTLWQPGTDHAGIATQMVVERQLEAQQISKQELGREAFIEKIWQWKQQSGGNISKQLRRMGVSVDWRRERFTLDTGLSKAVSKVFTQLYQEGLIYKGTRLVNWDPKFRTAISDLEVVNIEEKGKLYYVRYPMVQPTADFSHLLIATTRPETILADGALAVHPDDQRYQHLLGKQVWVPMTNRKIPIIADDYVDSNFGSGCVKITPAHDFNDYQVGQRHTMEVINLFSEDAHLNENAPAQYVGLERFQARDAIVADLKQANLLEEVREHTFNRPYGDRSNVVIEPYLTSQWFMNTGAIAKLSIEVVKRGDITFVPKNWQNTYFQWLENIQDWCISRQLWWGHRIPAWYDDKDNVYVAENEEQAYQQARQQGYQGVLSQDQDVLDTWFSSALWPFSTLGWPEQTESYRTYYPTSVLVTGFDIIFFWVARMIMLGLKFTNQVPFKQVYVHGLVRDSKGQKMSKSKGNVLDPIDIIDGINLQQLIDKRTQGLMQPQKAVEIAYQTKQDYPQGIPAYGCDALRFSFLAMASTGRDIRFDISRCEGYRNFCNKLWNAARFCLMHSENYQLTDDPPKPKIAINQWMLSRLNSASRNMAESIQEYRFDWVANQLYELVWRDFCDWYIEVAKMYLQQSCQETFSTLIHSLEQICRLSHPMIPFISEEIWQELPLPKQQPSIMVSAYPEANDECINIDIEQKFQFLQELVSAVRSLRSHSHIKPSQPVCLQLSSLTEDDQSVINLFGNSIQKLCNLSSIEELPQLTKRGFSTTLKHLTINIPFLEDSDQSEQKQRLSKQLHKLQSQSKGLKNKLNNPHYRLKAPPEVVAKTEANYKQLCQAESQLQQLLQQMSQIN